MPPVLYRSAMRITAAAIANGAAWAVFAVIFALAVVMADVLGFLGLFILGVITWMVCVRAGQEDDPYWLTARPRTENRRSAPEEQASRMAHWQTTLEPVRFFARCGMALTAIGAAGFAWQYWMGVASNGH